MLCKHKGFLLTGGSEKSSANSSRLREPTFPLARPKAVPRRPSGTNSREMASSSDVPSKPLQTPTGSENDSHTYATFPPRGSASQTHREMLSLLLSEIRGGRREGERQETPNQQAQPASPKPSGRVRSRPGVSLLPSHPSDILPLKCNPHDPPRWEASPGRV